ncbi:hypothetical protein DNTS_021033 [Danionella cerebrum]|uniref:ZBR-type domain-containing protein n=1 Tax=Danionella cerebrum TaxID=2873325 RepID=A0A553MU30_9TELE|nr:hypothetical protein DNTS_021033 [Danionella translucida]
MVQLGIRTPQMILHPGVTPVEGLQNKHCTSFDSPLVSPPGPLRFSTLKPEEFIFSCQKRRLLFSQALTSTVEGAVQLSPVVFSNPEADLDETIIISGPASSPQSFTSPPRAEKKWHGDSKTSCSKVLEGTVLTPNLEDSGFNSLGLDKSHNSSVDHDGSFQELVTPQGSSGREKRRSRLERQRRLSTLKEGGSQSEDHTRPPERVGSNKDEVFLDCTPLSAALPKMQGLSLTPALQVVHALSMRCAQSFQQQSSLDEILQLSEVDQSASLSLSGLIGRKMGLATVDVISELRIRSMRHILTIILSLLTSADLYRFGQVSEEWNEVICEDRKAAHRRKRHIRELKVLLEGGGPHLPEADTRAVLECRAVLGSVQAQAKTPHSYSSLSCTPSRSSSKHAQFMEVAHTLFSDEFLKPCPRCQHPARCHNLRAEGVCSWSDCGLRFCMSCLCEAHGSKDCTHTPLSHHTRTYSHSDRSGGKKELLPGSARSKRNVRRSALSNPVTRLQFQKFLSLQDDRRLENDLLFWLEVQRFKDMVDSHCGDRELWRKISIILRRFFCSSLPPPLQIHTPPGCVLILEQNNLDPYIFRELQTYVFNELQKIWLDFMSLCSSTGEENLPLVLDQKLRVRQMRRRTGAQSSHSQVDVMQERVELAVKLNTWTFSEDSSSGNHVGNQLQLEVQRVSSESAHPEIVQQAQRMDAEDNNESTKGINKLLTPHLSTKIEMTDQIILEQFSRMLNLDTRCWVVQNSLSSSMKAVPTDPTTYTQNRSEWLKPFNRYSKPQQVSEARPHLLPFLWSAGSQKARVFTTFHDQEQLPISSSLGRRHANAHNCHRRLSGLAQRLTQAPNRSLFVQNPSRKAQT